MRPGVIPRTWARRTLLALVSACLLLDPLVAARAEPPEAERFVQSVADRTMALLNQPAVDQAGRVRAMTEILDQAVDVDTVARLVVGRHWADATDAQRADYISLFQPFAIGILAHRFSAYTGTERFIVTGSRAMNDRDQMVSTQIQYTGGYPPLHLDWRVRTGKDRPRIVDVVAEGVSWILTNRSEFDSLINQRGFDGLLREMKQRAAASGSAP